MNSIFNIDTLEVSFDVIDYEKMLVKYVDELEVCKELSKKHLYNNLDDREYIKINDLEFQVMASGARGYAYLLHNDLFELRLSRYRSNMKSFYPVVVKFKSQLLWEMGITSYSYIADFIRTAFNDFTETKVGRVDFALHIDGLNFKVTDIDCFVGRFRKDSLKRCDRKVETLYFGSRNTNKCLCRIYNKTREVLETRSKYWFFDIWDKSNMVITNTWNVEFELHRDFLKECKINTWDELRDNISSLWHYLTHDWIRYVDILSASRIENCNTMEVWEYIQTGCKQFELNGYIRRELQRLRDTNKYVPSAMGYLSSLSALVGIDNVDDAIYYLKFTMEKYLFDKKGITFEDVVQEKMKYFSEIKV